MNVEVNFLEILLAGVVSMVIGFLWYSPLLLGRPWMKARGMTAPNMKEAQKAMGKLYGLSFVVSLVTAFVLSHVMTMSAAYFAYPMLSTGLNTAFWMWLGFIMPTQLTATLFGNRNWTLFGIDTGYQLAALVGMAVVIALV